MERRGFRPGVHTSEDERRRTLEEGVSNEDGSNDRIASGMTESRRRPARESGSHVRDEFGRILMSRLPDDRSRLPRAGGGAAGRRPDAGDSQHRDEERQAAPVTHDGSIRGRRAELPAPEIVSDGDKGDNH